MPLPCAGLGRANRSTRVVNGMGLRVTIDVDTVTKGGISGNRVASLQEEPARQRLTIVQALATNAATTNKRWKRAPNMVPMLSSRG